MSQRNDPNYDNIRRALHALRTSGAALYFVSHNLVEFWNVCTRPIAQNGYGLTTPETDRRAALIEANFPLLPDKEQVRVEWVRLVVVHSVSGIQVHDARIVAAMNAHGIPIC